MREHLKKNDYRKTIEIYKTNQKIISYRKEDIYKVINFIEKLKRIVKK